jgi:hypothetical protein
VIDRLLVTGTALRNIAEQFPLSVSALFRHKAHVEARIVEARRADEIDAGRSLASRLDELASIARRALQRAERTSDTRTALLALRELSRLLEVETRVESQAARVQINVAAFDLTTLSDRDKTTLVERLLNNGGRLPIAWVQEQIAELDEREADAAG